jgi:hypothetical protein
MIMPRLMSVSLTEQQVRDRTKLVTRRLGWLTLEPGDTLTLCRKVMGRKKGEPLVRIVDVDVMSVRRERLDAITAQDVDLEGFPGMTPAEFIEFFCGSHKGCTPDTEVTRIEWRWADEPAVCGQPEGKPELHDILPRLRTPDRRNDDGSTTITVQRCCNGCGDPIGDVTFIEINLAIDGLPLPDVRPECPRCRPTMDPPLAVVEKAVRAQLEAHHG